MIEMLENFSFFLPVYNESHRLLHHRRALSLLRHATIIDAGSTDGTLEIVHGWGLPFLQIVIIPNPHSEPRTPTWYQKVIKYSATKHFMIGNVGHVYSVSLLRELDVLCSNRDVDVVSIPNLHYFCNQLDSTFGDYRPPLSPSALASLLFPPKQRTSGQLLHCDVIDWRLFRIHNELPVAINNPIVLKRAKNCIYSFRDEDTYSLEIKHAGYSTSHAKDLQGLGYKKPISQRMLFITYFAHFFHCWLYKASFIQGVAGFVTAHYWASYHLSVKIRLWELQNNLTQQSLVKMHNYRRGIMQEL